MMSAVALGRVSVGRAGDRILADLAAYRSTIIPLDSHVVFEGLGGEFGAHSIGHLG